MLSFRTTLALSNQVDKLKFAVRFVTHWLKPHGNTTVLASFRSCCRDWRVVLPQEHGAQGRRYGSQRRVVLPQVLQQLKLALSGDTPA